MTEIQNRSTASHYVLIKEAGVYVKEGKFFRSQGGLVQDWGKNWEPIMAESLYDAQYKGIALRRARFPNAGPTLGENESLETVWPEAKGK